MNKNGKFTKEEMIALGNFGMRNRLIGCGPVPNSHGCADYFIGKIISVKDGLATVEVIEAQSCSSCWQVGHDREHVFAKTGERLSLDVNEISPNTSEWSTNVDFSYDGQFFRIS